MPGILSSAAVALIVLCAMVLGTATGFGATVIAIPLCSFFIDLRICVPMLALAGSVPSLYLLIIDRHHVDWAQFRIILLWTCIGFPFGNVAFHYLQQSLLNLGLGIFVTAVAVHGLVQLLRGQLPVNDRPMLGRILLFGGGLMHGAFAAGSPLVVAYATRALAEKRSFRATMQPLWIILNVAFLCSYFASEHRQMAAVWLALICVPGIVAGIYFGEKLHHRVSETTFRGIVFATLLLAGILRLVC